MQNNSKRALFFVSAAFVFASLVCGSSYGQVPDGSVAARSSTSFASLFWFPGAPKSGTITNSSSELTRNMNGVWYYITTTELLPGGAYTVWWVIFNHPEFCSPPGCGAKDLPANGGDPRIEASVLWASGRVVDANGQGSFSGHLALGGAAAAPGQVLFGPALLNPMVAEIHLIVRSHGPALTGSELQAQLTSFEGACAVNHCANEQAVKHLPRPPDDGENTDR